AGGLVRPGQGETVPGQGCAQGLGLCGVGFTRGVQGGGAGRRERVSWKRIGRRWVTEDECPLGGHTASEGVWFDREASGAEAAAGKVTLAAGSPVCQGNPESGRMRAQDWWGSGRCVYTEPGSGARRVVRMQAAAASSRLAALIRAPRPSAGEALE